MKYVFIALLLLSTQADAAVRRLSECGAFPGTPTEAVPFDLDLCALNEGDDITQLLLDVRSRWPGGFYVRAPSKSLTVISNTIKWPTGTKFYVFMEDQDPANKLRIQHASEPSDFWTMWWFENFDTVKLGGPNLSMTLRGNHPGLANCYVQRPLMLAAGWPEVQANICDANRGLLDFRVTDGTTANLVGVSGNIQYSQHYSIYTAGSTVQSGTANKIRQFNIAGTHFATSGVFFHAGVINAWADPERTVFEDPYMRAIGWNGEVPGPLQDGLPMGCNDRARQQNRIASFNGYYFQTLTGGMTLRYGAGGFVKRFPGRIGSAAEPFVIKLQDIGVSGPGTGLPAGVRVKKNGEALFFKGDPADAIPGYQPSRFIRLIKLPDQFGSGPAHNRLKGCSGSDNDYVDGPSNFFRFENNVGLSNQGYRIEWVGDWRTPAQGGTFLRGELARFGTSADTAANFKHEFRITVGSIFPDLLTLRDESTVTGPGTYTDLAVADASPAVQGRNSSILDTNVRGTVTVHENTENTTIRNVRFLGAARSIIFVGAGSSVNVSKLCAPAGSSIVGTGSVLYEGAALSLPHTISNANNCMLSEDPVPAPPRDVIVE